MRIITFKDIYNLNLDKNLFFDWAKETFLNKYSTLLPAKTSIHYYDGEGFVNTMPAIIPSINAYGVKVVSRNPKSVPTLKSNLMLFDLSNNDLLGIMDADYITAFRTGATAALAIETLASDDYSTVALIGLGNICRAFVLVLLNHVKNKTITFKLYLYEGTDNGIIELLSQFKNIKIETYDNIKDTIINSDVVVSCVTYAKDDLAKPEWFKKGCLLVPVHTRGFLNCDLEFDRIIIDDHNHCKDFRNYSKFKNLHELGEVLKDKSLGRANNKERIIAYNIGLSILDITFAKKIYDLLKDTKEDIAVSGTKPLYWVK